MNLEEIKAVLLNTFFLRKVEIYLKYKLSDDPKYPDSFWRVYLYKKFEIEKDWAQEFTFDVDSLEQAIARSIIWEPSSIDYEECEVPDHLKNWKLYRIIVEESVSRKDKWGEIRENKRASIKYEILLSNGWTEDYSESLCRIDTALSFITKRYYEMIEGAVPYHWDYRNNENPLSSDYPMFEYKGHYFKTTHYIPDQKCVCGESETYIDDYEGDNSIKVEVWNVKCFERDNINHQGSKIIYNDQILDSSSLELNSVSFIRDDQLLKLRKMFPDAKGYNNQFEWRSFGNET